MIRFLFAIALVLAAPAFGALTETYVSVAGAGAHDGTSAANAWTLAEALTVTTGAQPGDRVNVISGAYSIGATTVGTAGTTTSSIIFRGYGSSIGDLESVGRPGPGDPLTVTNHPVITLTGILTSANYIMWESLSFTTTTANAWSATGQYNKFWRCKLEYTGGGGAVGAFRAFGNYGTVKDCDIITNATSTTGYAVMTSRNSWTNCLIDCGGAGASGVDMLGFSNLDSCVIFDGARGIILTSSGDRWDHCSINNMSLSGVYISSGTPAGGSNTIIYDCDRYGIEFSATSVSGGALLSNIAIGDATLGAIGNQGDNPGIKEEVVLTADPFTSVTPGSEDWRPNDTAGGGADCRNADMFGGDLGALQHEDVGGGGGTSQLVNGGLVK